VDNELIQELKKKMEESTLEKNKIKLSEEHPLVLKSRIDFLEKQVNELRQLISDADLNK
jgi:hypothetical protein